jgi:hypothetical protein
VNFSESNDSLYMFGLPAFGVVAGLKIASETVRENKVGLELILYKNLTVFKQVTHEKQVHWGFYFLLTFKDKYMLYV